MGKFAKRSEVRRWTLTPPDTLTIQSRRDAAFRLLTHLKTCGVRRFKNAGFRGDDRTRTFSAPRTPPGNVAKPDHSREPRGGNNAKRSETEIETEQGSISAKQEWSGDDRTRTDDLLVANQALSQLSYVPSSCGVQATEWPAGIEVQRRAVPPHRRGCWQSPTVLSDGAE